MKRSRRRSVFAEDSKGNLYIEAKCLMTPLVAIIDGLPVAFFGKSKKMYLTLDVAIDWCEKEKPFHSTDRLQRSIDLMKRCKEEQASGKVEYT